MAKSFRTYPQIGQNQLLLINEMNKRPAGKHNPPLRHFEFDQVEIFQGISLPEPQILFYSNGLAFLRLPDIRHILKLIMADSRPFWGWPWNSTFCFSNQW